MIFYAYRIPDLDHKTRDLLLVIQGIVAFSVFCVSLGTLVGDLSRFLPL